MLRLVTKPFTLKTIRDGWLDERSDPMGGGPPTGGSGMSALERAYMSRRGGGGANEGFRPGPPGGGGQGWRGQRDKPQHQQSGPMGFAQFAQMKGSGGGGSHYQVKCVCPVLPKVCIIFFLTFQKKRFLI